MKTLINITVMLMLCSFGNAQCLVYADEEMAKYCHGTRLTVQELNNKVTDANLLLNKGNVYTIYLMNPAHSHIQYNLVNDFYKQGNYLQVTYKKEDYNKYVIPCDQTIDHKISLKLGNDVKACILLAVYLQDSLPGKRAGIYNSFDDFKNNTPVPGYITSFSEEKERDVIYYSISNKEDRKKYKNIYGFCDGAEMYFNVSVLGLTYRRINHFAKAEKIGSYYYLKTTRLIIVSNVPVRLTIPFIIDSKTGEVTEFTKRSLKKIISNDPDLLTEFQSEKNKQKELKEYLRRYEMKGDGR